MPAKSKIRRGPPRPPIDGVAFERHYPIVMSEEETVQAIIAGRSIGRYGDGELRVIVGGNCISQLQNAKLAKEMRDLLAVPDGPCLAGIPNVFSGTPKKQAWLHYATPQFSAMYDKSKKYASSFITRPDSAPWIDTPEYWSLVRSIWRGHDVILAIGDRRSLRPEEIQKDAASVQVVESLTKNAYADIDRLEEEIGTTSKRVLMCLGCTATALANRLAKKGVHAIDLGHMGMFMRHAGAYRYTLNDLTSEAHRRAMHAARGNVVADKITAQEQARTNENIWHRHADDIMQFLSDVNAGDMSKATLLDYGCGDSKLRLALLNRQRVLEYDPGVPGKEGMPKPVDLVACIDVLQYVEPDKLSAVLDHMSRISRAAYIAIDVPASIVDFWKDRLRPYWQEIRFDNNGHELKAWCKR